MPSDRPSAEALQAFRDVAPGGPEAEDRKMFGCPCGFVHGNMFMGLHGDGLFLRLSPGDRAALTALGGAAFAPGGRAMREYVTLPPAILADSKLLQQWVGRAYAFASTMPTKEKKPRTAGKKKTD